MSQITGILIIAFTSIAIAAVIPPSEVSPLPIDSDTANTQIISNEAKNNGDLLITDNDNLLMENPIDEETITDSPNDQTCDEFECLNPQKIDLEAQEFPDTDLNDTDEMQTKNDNTDEKKIEFLNKIDSALNNAKQAKYCSDCQPLSAPVGLPLDMVPIFKPRRCQPCDDKVSQGTNTMNVKISPINTELQYSRPLYNTVINKENVMNSDDMNAILKTRSYPSLGSNNCNSPNLSPSRGLNTITKNYNTGCSRPLKIVQITKAQGNVDLNSLNTQRPCQQNTVPSCSRSNAKIVIYKPEKVVVEEAYGQFLKKRLLDVLIPYYVSQLPPYLP